MRIESYHFGVICIDGRQYAHDVILTGDRVRKRKKKRSKPFRGPYGHTPLSLAEKIPWKCKRLIVGTGAQGGLPVLDEVKREASRRGIELTLLPTPQAIAELDRSPEETHAILHVTC
jgi:hypothetical protein